MSSNAQPASRESVIGLLFGLVLVAVVAAAFVYKKEPPRPPQPLGYDVLRKQWSAEKNAFAGPAGEPLYDRAEVRYGSREVKLRAARRNDDGSETWYAVEAPSRGAFTDEFFARLQTVPEFEFARTWPLAQAVGGTLLGLLLTLGLFVGMVSVGREQRRTSSVFPLFIGVVFCFTLWGLHTALPSLLWSGVRAKLFESGPIPWAILGTTTLGLSYLIQIWAVHLFPFQEAQLTDQDVISAARSGDLYRLAAAVNAGWNQNRRGFYLTGFRRLLLLYQRDGEISAVQRLQDEILEGNDRTFHLSFTAVRFVEWILPLLGFLGTVVGLGGALLALKDAIVFKPDGTAVVEPDKVGETFAGMGLKFDATFEGLAGLMLVGGCHFFLRKKIDQALTDAQIIFSEAVEGWQGHVPRVRVIESAPDVTIVNLQHTMADLASRQEVLFDALIRCVREDPELYARFGRILFDEGVVSPGEYRVLVDRLRREIARALGAPNWELRAVAHAPGAPGRCACLVAVAGRAALCQFEIAAGAAGQTAVQPPRLLNGDYDRMVVCGGAVLLRNAADTRLHWCRNGAVDPAPAFPAASGDNDCLAPVPVGRPDGAVLLHRNPDDRRLTYLPAAPGAQPAVVVPSLREGCEWRLSAFSPDGRRFVVSGDSKNEGSLFVYRVTWPAPGAPAPAGAAAPDAPAGTGPTFTRESRLKLPLVPVQIEWLSPDELILVGATGAVLDYHLGRQSSTSVVPPNTAPIAGTSVCVGPGRQLAVFRPGALAFWRVTVGGGGLAAAGGHQFQADNIAPPRVAAIAGAAGNGFLVGGSADVVVVWDFPQPPAPVAPPAPPAGPGGPGAPPHAPGAKGAAAAGS